MSLPLITSPMYFDTVLNALVALLTNESQNQIDLGGEGWTTVKERFDPWNSKADEFPLVNVIYNSGSFDQSKGSHSDQTHNGAFILDCYASSKSTINDTRDQLAAEALHILITKVYYTIMSEINREIGLPTGKIVNPWVDRIEKFVPTETNVPIEGVIAARISLSLQFKEFPPIGTGNLLDVINVKSDINNQTDGNTVEQEFQNLQS